MRDKKIDGRGRPVKGLPRTEKVTIRMNVGEKATLSYLSEKLGMSSTDVIVSAIKDLYKNTDK